MIRKTDIKVVQLILTGLKKEKECHYRKERENPLNAEGFGEKQEHGSKHEPVLSKSYQKKTISKCQPLHLFIQWIFTKYLLCVKCYCRHWRDSSDPKIPAPDSSF